MTLFWGDDLILSRAAIPTLSPYSLPTYTALAVGVAAGLVMMRLWLGVEARVTCQNDTFVSDTWTRPIPASPKPY